MPKRSTRERHERLRPGGLGDALVVGDGLAARSLDLRHDPVRGRGVAVLAVDRAADVVDDDLGAEAGERQRVLPPEPPTRPRHERHAPVQANRHASASPL